MEGEAFVPHRRVAYAGWLLAALVLLHLAAPLTPVPAWFVAPASVLATLLFFLLWLSIVYQWSAARWRLPALAGAVVVALAALAAAILLGRFEGTEYALSVLRQVAIIVAAGGIGMMVAVAIRDPNLLVPIAPILAIVDIVTVMSPAGIAKRVIETKPEAFEAVAVSVPRFGTAKPELFMGPADVLFLAMFLAVIHRGGFRVKATYLWLLVVLVAYMLLILGFGEATMWGISLRTLPALVPMGAVILIVNWRRFSLNRQEKVMTWALVLIAVLLAAAAFSLKIG
jgi:hypothetical protein